MSNKSRIVLLSILALAFAVGAGLYSTMPEKVAVHWNIAGKADGFAGKPFGIFLLPVLMVFICAVFELIIRIDPLKSNIESFKKHYEMFVIYSMCFMLYIYGLTLMYNKGYVFNMATFMIPPFSALFFIIGNVIENSRRNWFVGIRTPWTLSSDDVWARTHKLGSKLYKISSGITLLGMIFQTAAVYFMVVPVLASSIYLLIFSYLIYNRRVKE